MLDNKIINGWNLFWLISAPLSIVVVVVMTRSDLTTVDAVSSLIQLSVRFAVPLLYLAFAASSLHALFPSTFSRWLRRNRSKIGLCFAVAMAWQLLFIVWMVSVYTDYYVEEVYVLSDVVEGTMGFLFLFAMVITSFRFGRSRLSPTQWSLLHTVSIYWLWAYAWSVYWWNLFYYEDPEIIDYIYYWTGFLAWGLRICAWTKTRWQQTAAPIPTA